MGEAEGGDASSGLDQQGCLCLKCKKKKALLTPKNKILAIHFIFM